MRDALTILGLFINMCGCGMLYLESARVSRSISVAGPRLGNEEDEDRAKFKDTLISWWGRAAIVVVGVGFLVQVVAMRFPE